MDIVVKAGNRELVLLVHGLTGAPDEMRYVAKKLSDQGFDIYGPLLAGHGKGYRELKATTWRHWLQTVVEAYDRLAPYYDKVHVVGVCVGGMLGLLLAKRRPIATCVVYSPVFHFDGWSMKPGYRLIALGWPLMYLPLARDILVPEVFPFGLKDERLRNLASQSQTQLIPGALDAMPFSSLADMYRLGQAVLREGKGFETPTLILHAEEDDMGNKRNAELLKTTLGESARLIMLNDSYHMIHVDKERSKVAKLTLDALKWGMPATRPAAQAKT